jgi:hypothetical protein
MGQILLKKSNKLYDNEYASIINTYFYELFLSLKPRVLALQNIWDTLSDILDKCLRFPLIKLRACLYCICFPIKMLSLVLIKN